MGGRADGQDGPQESRGFPDYRLRITYPGEHVVEIDDPYRYGRVLTDFDLHLLGEGTHHRAFEKLGAHRMTVGTTAGVHFAVWAPNADRVSVIGDFNAWDGRVHAMRLLSPGGIWEIFIPNLADGEKYKFEIRARSGAILKKTDPYGVAFEVPPQSAAIVHDISRYTWHDAAWMDAASGARRVARAADVDLRSPSRIVGARARGGQPVPDLPRDGAPARAVREGHGLHPHRAAAGDGASLFGIVGLSGAGVLRADQPVRPARGFQAVRRRLPSGRTRRHPRLGPGPLSEGRARARDVRRHRAVRARRSAAGRAPGLGHAHLQLRAPRGPQLPAVERAVLARGVPRRRPARGCGRVDAVSRLLAPAGTMGAERVRRPREPRRHRVSPDS